MYKCIFSDIDGTLRNSKREITEKTKECIKELEDKGIETILCSGRPRVEVEKVSKECNASRYIISSNGAEVYDYISRKTIYSNPIDEDTCKKLYNIAEECDCTISMHKGDNRLVNKNKYNDETEIIVTKDEVKSMIIQGIVQCVIMDKDIKKVQVVREKVQKIENVKIINESKCLYNANEKNNGTIYCDIVTGDTSKGQALNALCNFLNINSKKTIGIGDSFNDIDMLNSVGYSVAMGNAVDSIKEKADEITTTNDQEGAASFFEKVLKDKVPIE